MITVPFTPVAIAAEATPINGSIIGEWKDGLCGCCKFGCCHPHLCCACMCPVALMGQVLTRMKMTWLGNTARNEAEYRTTFRNTICVIIVCLLLTFIPRFEDPDPVWVRIEEGIKTPYYIREYPELPLWQNIVNKALNLSVALAPLYAFIVLVRLRRAVRKKYSIRDERCSSCEDCCCALYCGCCTVAQLARQTADYEVQRASCCTDTGLKPIPPVMTV
mmetsp:Transcript_14261/g.20000  ORF Transcript_14261/g.20000 Transcript_14261/m.20000 type:complete len:219 (-) Transcript_14261:269-925(-)